MSHTLLHSGLGPAKLRNDGEGRSFRRRWVLSGRDFVATIGALMAVVFHSVSLVTDPYVAAPAYVPTLEKIHQIIVGALILWFVALRPMKLRLRHFFYPITLFSVASYAYILHLCVLNHASIEDITLASAGALALGTFCVLLCPCERPVVCATGVAYWVMIWLAYDGDRTQTRWLVVDALSIAGATAFHFGRMMLAERQAAQEFTRLNSLGKRAHGEQVKRRDAEQQLVVERSKAEQAAKMASLAEMTGGIAHEINNPLSVIKVRADRLSAAAAAGALSPELVIEGAKRIADTVDRIAKIMKGMRNITRNGDGDPFAPEALDAIVTDVAELSQFRFKMEDIAFESTHADAGLTLECRAVEIAQVLVNLLNNACDAVEGQPQRWVRLATRREGDGVEIRISDSGKGVTGSRDRIFEPLYTTKRVGSGTGLGLSIAKAIIEAHGGRIGLAPDSRHTQFVVWLPKVQRVGDLEAA